MLLAPRAPETKTRESAASSSPPPAAGSRQFNAEPRDQIERSDHVRAVRDASQVQDRSGVPDRTWMH
jgi:hypothetical protein